MGRRLARWRQLSGSQRFGVLCCAAGLALIHACLATSGYARTRRWIEALTAHASTSPPTPQAIARARSLAQLAAIAGRHGAVEATCLRQSLLLYGWLRRRGLQPALYLGMKTSAQRPPTEGAFQAHAWVELNGIALHHSDAGHRPFVSPTARDGAD